MRNKWRTIRKQRYYFFQNGQAATGIRQIGKYRYAFSYQGQLQRSRFGKSKGNTFYADANGRIVTGWQTLNKKRYYFSSKGVMATGWTTINKKRYYFSSKGVMATGWTTIKKKTYYFNGNGVLQTNKWIGSRYVNKNGVYTPDPKNSLAKLKTQLDNVIRSYPGSWSIYVKNLNTNATLSINDRSMYAASLIKLYAMGAAYDCIQKGTLSEAYITPTLTDMITVSDNYAFNELLHIIGNTRVNVWCRANGFSGTNQGSGIYPADNYAGLNNGSGTNVTSPSDCGAFLESVYRGTCVSKACSAKMLNLLKRQTRRHKIPAGVPSGVTVANKTGETNDYMHDAAIVYSKGAVYILVVMGECPGIGVYDEYHIRNISRIVYNYFN